MANLLAACVALLGPALTFQVFTIAEPVKRSPAYPTVLRP